ncbi:AAA domain-containing protein [Curtobacterium sp. PhB130]|nr:AAA domain-containing protein [Curtobacterium sp. ZW137]ROS74993.1 AAA domain-containing protein [Curtobacterium sp. PhB130]
MSNEWDVEDSGAEDHYGSIEIDLSAFENATVEDFVQPAQRPPRPATTILDLYDEMTPAERKAQPASFWDALRAENARVEAWDNESYGTGRTTVATAEEGSDEPTPMFIELTDIDTSDPVLATVGARVDGPGLLYAGAVNGLIGDPEQGKSLVAVALALQTVHADEDRGVVWLDLDHNGARAFRGRLDSFGATKLDLLGFSFAQPEDSEGVLALVEYVVAHADDYSLFVIDSIGELLPMFGASSDSADEYTKVNRQVAARVAKAGIAVLTIDHLAKGADSRAFGGTGTVAKKRAVDGALYRVEATTPFAPTTGGTATLRLLKDRHGSVRDLASATSAGVREPVVTSFVIDAADGSWHFAVPGQTLTPDQMKSLRVSADAQLLDGLTPPPTSQRDVQTRMKWGSDRALDALREWRSSRD